MVKYLLSILVVLKIIAVVPGQTKYEVIDLGSLGGASSGAWAINDSSQVVGISELPNGSSHAFLWDNGILIDLGTLGGSNSEALDINNLSQIVGTSSLSNNQNAGFLWNNNQMANLGVGLELNAINDLTQIVGKSSGNSAFIWENGSLFDLGTFGGIASTAKGINNIGQVIGYYTYEDNFETYYNAFLWHNGQMTELGNLGIDSRAEEINDLSQIVGNSRVQLTYDYGHAFLWENGIMQDLGTLSGLDSRANSINDSSQIVGFSGVSFLFYHACIWYEGSVYDLNNLIPENSGWLLWEARDINNKGEIVGWGIYNEQPRAFLLRPVSLRITNPQAGEKWIAGEADTIRWTGSKKNGWEIFVSDNDGFSYQSLNVILPADDSMFVWTPPDSLETSSNYRIKVIDALDINLFAESEPFAIRAYDLVRLTSDGKYEKYKPSLHGWSVVNYSDYIWPPSWYNQYNYRTGEDPFTLQPYYNKFAILTRADSSDFPDWPTFVETFGVEKCYEIGFLSGNPYQPKQRAMEAWRVIKMDYGGACFGFPSSALLAFEQASEFFAQNQLLQPTPTIFELNSLIPIRKTIIKYFLYQSDSTSLAHDNDSFTKSVRETLDDIKEMLMNDNGPHSILSLQPPVSGGHAVVPHKLVRDTQPEGAYKLYVYDPNSPGENREYILLDSLGNTWQEFLDLDYGVSSDGLFINLPINHFLQVPILAPLEKSYSSANIQTDGFFSGSSTVSLYTQTKSDLLILSDTGDSLGYVGGNLIRKMANAGPIIPAVGGFTSPIGYTMPSANYSLWLSQFEDSLSTVLFSENGILYRYERLNPQLNQIDKFTLGDGISVYGDEEKEILLRSIGGNNKEIVYELSNITIMAGDSIRTIHSPDDDLRVSNKGSNKSYNLRVQQLDPYQAIEFEHYNISLSENTTHYLSLVDSLLTSIRILIDVGNDGTIDDTLYVANAVDVKDERSLLSPKSYNLAQNYPNPFNPATIIQYSIPQRSNVTLKVYDILGNEVAALVNEEKEKGVYTTNFDASQLASGVYFYRLQAGNFVETKKMILLR